MWPCQSIAVSLCPRVLSSVAPLLLLWLAASSSGVASFPESVHSTASQIGRLVALRDFSVVASDGAALTHFSADSHHMFRSLSADGSSVDYSHLPSKSAVRDGDGLYQPFPSSLTLTFSAFNSSYSLPLTLAPPPFDATTRIEVMSPYNEPLAQIDAVSSSYRWTGADGGSEWAMVVLREDGRFHLVLQSADGEVLQADPVEHFKHDMEASSWHAMSLDSERGMMIYKHSDLINLGDRKCGAEEGDATQSSSGSDSSSGNSSSTSAQPASRRLLQAQMNDFFPTDSTEASISNFGCLSSNQRLSIAVLSDAGFSAMFGGRANDITAAVASIFSVINILYLKQLSLFLTVTSLQIFLEPNPIGGPNPWNLAPPTLHGTYCSNPAVDGSVTNINSQLEALNTWRVNYQPTNGGQHHLMTNCWPPPGVVGLSFYYDICLNEYAESVSSYNAPYWITVGHEIAHTLGALHTFGLGGIMDYGGGAHYPLPNGPYQFHPTNQQQICYIVNDQMSSDGIMPYCMTPYQSVCGNGIVEPDEQCDDSSACCTSQCTLAAGAQCSSNSTCCLSTCQYAPSTTLCAGNNGVCTNGECQLSSCPGQYPLCGMTGGGCQQMCKVGSSCIALSGSYALKDNVTCSLSPYGVCQSGQCAVTSITYSYAASAWSSCSCNATQSRSVLCSGSDGNPYSLSMCNGTGAMPASAQSCTVPSSCYSFAFNYSAWSACSQTCDSGVQTRAATCLLYSEPAVELPLANCTAAGATLQSLSSSCNVQSCTYMWQSTAYGACSADCGGGVATRASTCYRAINGGSQQMTAADCVAQGLPAPSDSEACNSQACDVYGWSYGSWTSCNASCGGGLQTRTALCMDVTTNQQADAQHCTALQQPVTSQQCNTQLCPSLQWLYGGWSDCSATCGGGVESRSVQCWDSVYGQWYPNASCSAVLSSPLVLQSCNTDACPSPPPAYYWQASPYWAACPVVCGGGVQYRNVSCIDPRNSLPVSTSLCNVSSEPPTSQACNTRTCNIYSWVVSGWSVCSSWCAGGTQVRAVQCSNFYTGELSPWTTCAHYMTTAVPSQLRDCNSAVPCVNGTGALVVSGYPGFAMSEWSACSVQCGGGYAVRNVTCVNATLCDWSAAPSPVQTCNSSPCSPIWSVGQWSQCSQSCGGGSMSRSVSCIQYASNGTVSQVNSSSCLSAQPSVNAVCNYFPCPSLVYSDWSACSASCGIGAQTRNVSCLNFDGTTAASSQCAALAVDALQQPCMTLPCPHWHRELWSQCDAPCGGGSQNRTVACRLPHDSTYEGLVVDSSLCVMQGAAAKGDGPGADTEGSGVPATAQTCNSQSCPLYYWMTAATSNCSVECGGGTQSVAVGCWSGAGSSRQPAAASLCDASSTPSSVAACNTAACSSYSWSASSWSLCSAACGTGWQSRVVMCVAANGSMVDDTECEDSLTPPTEQACSVPESTCWGANIALDADVNGVCDSSSSTCLCRSGWTGATCQEAPTISDVETGTSSFTHGVALSEVLVIQWQWTGAIDAVSVLLLRDNTTDWPEYGQYIGRYILNAGGYEWAVGSLLADLDPASDYRIRVWFSSQVWADSELFTIADPCGYVNCSAFGQCSDGVCVCMPGYSGSDCSVSPCEALQCNADHSECIDPTSPQLLIGADDEWSGLSLGACICDAGWSGEQCNTPPTCNTTCSGHGDTQLSSVVGRGAAVYQCGQCACDNNWSGPECSICPLSCVNGGVVDPTCSFCQCPDSGWFGPSCSCRYYELDLTLAADAASLMDEQLALTRFERTLATDLSIAAGVTTGQQVNIAILAVSERPDGQLSVSVRFAKDCPISSLYGSNAQLASDAADGIVVRGVSSLSIASLSSLQQQSTTQVSRSAATSVVSYMDLLATYNSFAALFGDSDSMLYKGAASAYINQSIQATASDSSGTDALTNPPLSTDRFAMSALSAAQRSSSSTGGGGGADGGGSKSSSSASTSSTAAIAGGVGGGVVLLLAVAGVLVYRSFRRRSSPSSSPRTSIFSSLPSGSPSSARPLPSPSRSRPITAKADRLSLPPPHIEISRYLADDGGHMSSSQSFQPSSPSIAPSEIHSPNTNNGHPSPLLPPAAFVTRSISDSTVAYVQHDEDDIPDWRRGAAAGNYKAANSRMMQPPPPPTLDHDSDMPALELTSTHLAAPIGASNARTARHKQFGATLSISSAVPPPIPSSTGGRNASGGPPPIPPLYANKAKPPPIPPAFLKPKQ